ncbi:unnamed protein product [Arctia plantaginis]|uniref:Uncharacterized protein n=1 Tax=Arctia plantaginis TaxID=874455 RepID=A0A8S0YZE1_ARCPL|nr:unnamed protein product [Arctia plantaginis]
MYRINRKNNERSVTVGRVRVVGSGAPSRWSFERARAARWSVEPTRAARASDTARARAAPAPAASSLRSSEAAAGGGRTDRSLYLRNSRDPRVQTAGKKESAVTGTIPGGATPGPLGRGPCRPGLRVYTV